MALDEKLGTLRSSAWMLFDRPLAGIWADRAVENSFCSAAWLPRPMLGRWSRWTWVTCWKLKGLDIWGFFCAEDASPACTVFRRLKMPLLNPCSFEMDICRGRSAPSAAMSYGPCGYPWFAWLSLLNLDFRLNMAFPMAWTLSGRSRMLLLFERVDDFLDKVSRVWSQDGRWSNDARESKEDEPDEAVCWLTCRSETDACLTLLLSALILPGDGGPSTAGSRKSAKFSASRADGAYCC